jgi:hypothetical protein
MKQQATSNKLKVCCILMHPSLNLMWNLGEQQSMREKLKHLIYHFQLLRENKRTTPSSIHEVLNPQQGPRGFNNQDL